MVLWSWQLMLWYGETMSIFEDALEIYHNSINSVKGPREVDTLISALNQVAAEPKDVAIVMDWDSVHEISDEVDAHVPVDDHVVRQHVELSTQAIGQAIGEKSTVHGVECNTPFGLVINPECVRLSMDIAHQPGVVRVDWVNR